MARLSDSVTFLPSSLSMIFGESFGTMPSVPS
eukprot:CAMPEP_0172556282 /NCGR_PEP_ID=MMETSP1067-20121228/64958_1 /TAXON_ID=265564 ORGANISM="Thalassiosira punctigera, Strain Tpunct2005C2" /NCGR_SAMPLE_ID=MMETSP1067 /ASSEMBLY_ACC=CAM_ASM_000444 /LENGTH=31 /DNA_ID= /DNA_START= /DNA_END= /DNA_ORIENTATION=